MMESTQPDRPHPIRAVECLEARIAPATIVSPTSITYTDTDGDAVTVTITKGTLSADDFVFDSAFDTATGQQLLRVAFANDLPKTGADLTFSVVQAGGDGLVHVGFIDATGIDLGTVTLPGDLGRIEAGNTVTTTAAVTQLVVGSIGTKGLDTQETGGTLTSNFLGALSALTVNGDVKDATLLVDGGLGGRDGKIGTVEITGSLIGGVAPKSGAIRAQGAITSVHIAGDILGGGGEDSGQVFSTRGIGTVAVDGSITALGMGGGKNSAQVFAGGNLGTATIGGYINGGDGEKSGQVSAAGRIASVLVKQSVIGGMGFESGSIGSGGALTSVTIKGDLVGYNADIAPDTVARTSGSILSDSTIGTVLIEGSIIGGVGTQSGIVAAARNIASVTVNGSIIGGTGEISGAIGSDRALGTVHVLGDVMGGSGFQSGEIVSKTGITSVTVDGSLLGGFGSESGSIGSLARIREVHIGSDVIGRDGFKSGWIVSLSRLDLVTIDGSLGSMGNFSFSGIVEAKSTGEVMIGGSLGAFEGASGAGFNPGFLTGGSVGKITIVGSLISTPDSFGGIDFARIGSLTIGEIEGVAENPVEITSRNALGSLTVTSNMTYASIVVGGGFDSVEQPANPDAQVGKVTVGGTWLASSLVVGVFIGNDGIFGTNDDFFGPPGNPTIFSKIASITIGGQSLGTTPTMSVTDQYGIIAQHIVSMRVGANSIALKTGPRNDALIVLDPVTGDFFLRERAFSGA